MKNLPPDIYEPLETAVIGVSDWVEPEYVSAVMATFDANSDGKISAEESKANDSHQSLFTVLTSLGANPDDLAAVLGIEPKDVREKRQEAEKEERNKMRRDWEEGQKFDREERERIRKERQDVTPVLPGDVKVLLTSKESARISVNYINNTKRAVTIKIRVGSTNRPDRTIAANKTAASTYTTSVAAGFSGQTLTVMQADTNAVIHLEKL